MTTPDPRLSLSGKVALVTGASRGIGAAIAGSLAGAGAHVVLASRGTTGLDRQVEAIASTGGKAVAMPVNVGDEDSVKALLPRSGIVSAGSTRRSTTPRAAVGPRLPWPSGRARSSTAPSRSTCAECSSA